MEWRLGGIETVWNGMETAWSREWVEWNRNQVTLPAAHLTSRGDISSIRTVADTEDLITMTIELLSLGPESILKQLFLHWRLWKQTLSHYSLVPSCLPFLPPPL